MQGDCWDLPAQVPAFTRQIGSRSQHGPLGAPEDHFTSYLCYFLNKHFLEPIESIISGSALALLWLWFGYMYGSGSGIWLHQALLHVVIRIAQNVDMVCMYTCKHAHTY